MMQDATAPRATENPRHVLGEAQGIHAQMEFLLNRVCSIAEDDNLTPETRLVMLAARLAEIDLQNDALDVVLRRVSAALMSAEAT